MASPRFDVEAVALSLMLTCPQGCNMATRGSLMPMDAWEACVTSFNLPNDGFAAVRIGQSGKARFASVASLPIGHPNRNVAIGHEIDLLIAATRDLINALPTAREMWLLEATIRRLKS